MEAAGEDSELLEDFRSMWQSELRQDSQDKQIQILREIEDKKKADEDKRKADNEAKAMEFYKEASESENRGNISAALENYRKAERLDPMVERKYHDYITIIRAAPIRNTSPTPPVASSSKRVGALPDLSTVLR
jgi:tetratricopeptide (TPR) repeat protein